MLRGSPGSKRREDKASLYTFSFLLTKMVGQGCKKNSQFSLQKSGKIKTLQNYGNK